MEVEVEEDLRWWTIQIWKGMDEGGRRESRSKEKEELVEEEEGK